MSIKHIPNRQSVEKYIQSRSYMWVKSTQVTAKAKLNTILSMNELQPLKLLQELKSAGKSAYTIRIYFELWRGFEKFCYGDNNSPADKFIKKNRGLFRNAYKDKSYLLSKEAYQKILSDSQKMHPGLYNMCVLMGMCGLRISEALKANWKDLSANGMLRVEGKGGTVRYVPVPVEKIIQSAFDKDGRIAGVKPPHQRFFTGKEYTSHDLRAFFATGISQLVGPYELMDLLGHNDFNTTLKYIRRNPQAIKEKLSGYYRGISETFGSDDRSSEVENKGG